MSARISGNCIPRSATAQLNPSTCAICLLLCRHFARCLEALAVREARLHPCSVVACLQAWGVFSILLFLAAFPGQHVGAGQHMRIAKTVASLAACGTRLTCTGVHGILHLVLHELLHCRVGLRWWVPLNLWDAECQIRPCMRVSLLLQRCASILGFTAFADTQVSIDRAASRLSFRDACSTCLPGLDCALELQAVGRGWTI